MKFTTPPLRSRGFSLAEILVTVAVIGIMAGISLLTFGNVNEGARLAHARNVTSKLNDAVKGFSQSNWDIPTAKDDSDTADELKVLRSLQYKPAASVGTFNTGAPFYPPNWNPSASTASTDFRVRWNGYNFELLEIGVDGKGLKMAFDGTDMSATPYTFPSDYKMEGAR